MTPRAVPLYLLAALDPPARLASRAYAAASGAHRLRLMLSAVSVVGWGTMGVVLVALSALTAPAPVQDVLKVFVALLAVAVGWRIADHVYALQCRRLDVLCLLVGDDAAVPLDDPELREWAAGALDGHRIAAEIDAAGVVRPTASWLREAVLRVAFAPPPPTALGNGYIQLVRAVVSTLDQTATPPPAVAALALTLALGRRPAWLDGLAISQTPVARVLADLRALAARGRSDARRLVRTLVVCPAAIRERTVASAVAAVLRAHDGLLTGGLREEAP